MNAFQILTASLTATACSAAETLVICDRQARKDVQKIQRWLTSEEVRQAKRRIGETLQWTAAIALALGAVAFVLGQEFRVMVDGFVEASLEVGPRVAPHTAIAPIALPADAKPLTVGEVVRWQRPTVAASVEVVEAAPVARPITARRARIEALFARAEELRQREAQVDAAIFTVATVAVNSITEEADAIARRWA